MCVPLAASAAMRNDAAVAWFYEICDRGIGISVLDDCPAGDVNLQILAVGAVAQ